MACAPSEDSDQAWHPPSLIRGFSVRTKQAWVLSYPLSHSEVSDQTVRMPMLIWVYARLWLDWANDQADLSLRWAHRSFSWYCHGAAHFMSVIKNIRYRVQRIRAVSQKYPLYVPFSASTVSRTSPNCSTMAREKVRIILNYKRCSRTMSNRYNVWNSSLFPCAIIATPE